MEILFALFVGALFGVGLGVLACIHRFVNDPKFRDSLTPPAP